MSERLLTITDLHTGYDGVAVVRDLSLHVDAGEVVALARPQRRRQDHHPHDHLRAWGRCSVAPSR